MVFSDESVGKTPDPTESTKKDHKGKKKKKKKKKGRGIIRKKSQ
jgi:hypothetical protein